MRRHFSQEQRRWVGLASPAFVELRLRTRRDAYLFISGLILASLGLAFSGGRIAVMEWLISSQDERLLQRAVELDPANPAPHYRLGSIYMLSFERQDPQEAFHQLRRATELNPHDGRYWLALAAASESIGDARTAQNAIQRAVRIRPMTPEFWWTAANYYLRSGRIEAAWDHFRRLLELSPAHAQAVFRLCYRAAGNALVVSENVLSPDAAPTLKLAYIDFVQRHGEHAEAFRLWKKMAAEEPQPKFTFSSAKQYLDTLLAQNRLDEATCVWNDLLRLQIISRPASSDGRDTVFNGDFEQPPLNAGFDWRTPSLRYVETDLQAPRPFRGAKCGRVDFTVQNNEEYEILSQIVPVDALREYQLHAYVRSEHITSDSGPRLRVTDVASPGRLDVTTSPVIGTTDWHPIALTFSTGPTTRLVRLAVWRARSRAFPMDISGSFWIDSVSMIAPGPASKQASAHETPLR